jgi:hypothetical protein
MRTFMLVGVAALGFAATSPVQAGSEQYPYDLASQPISASPVLRDTGSEATPFFNGVRTETQSNIAAKGSNLGASAYQNYAGRLLPVGDATRQIPGYGTPGAGSNGLYTHLQAQARIINAGFTDITSLTKNYRANWRGQAMRNGVLNQVSLDSGGGVSSTLAKPVGSFVVAK